MTTPATTSRRRLRRAGHVILDTGLVILALWFCSGFFGVAYGYTGREAVALSKGWLEIDWMDKGAPVTPFPTRPEFFRLPKHSWGRQDLLYWSYPTSPQHVIGFPLWWIGLPIAGAGGFLIYRNRAIKVGLCPKCLYDLAGLPPNSPCPECGLRVARLSEPGATACTIPTDPRTHP